MAETKPVPARLAPFLAQWDYIVEGLTERLSGLTDEEFLWEPAPEVWTVRAGPDARPVPDAESWAPDGAATPPRTLAWSMDHLGAGTWERADYLVGSHSLQPGDVVWPLTADAGLVFLF